MRCWSLLLLLISVFDMNASEKIIDRKKLDQPSIVEGKHQVYPIQFFARNLLKMVSPRFIVQHGDGA